jgi:hypothetical protein
MASTLDILKRLNEHHVIRLDLGGASIRVLDLDTLILAKKAMNTPKDRQVALELSAIRERLHDSDRA